MESQRRHDRHHNDTHPTGRALWEAHHGKDGAYDVLVQDGEAFAFAMFDALSTTGFEPLTGNAPGGEPRKTYDAKRAELYAYLDAHEVDPELRRLVDAMKEDEVYEFADQTFNEGMAFGKVVEEFWVGLQGLVAAEE